ncbi:unnamed protein product [marine sediment metagenome]|uniref:Uncharacterized protein n=1 Tax=marine sediment metagenome TaxID=412755 RepID=X0UG77_9ZZZZ
MGTLQRVLSLPFALRRFRVKGARAQLQEQKAEERHRRIAEEPHYSRRFRLEKECSNYRSIHFPR